MNTVWFKKIAASPRVGKLFAAPGNAGMEEATVVDIMENDLDGLVAFAKQNKIDLTIVGPEVPLMLGIADKFQEENLAIFAPDKEAALLEGSKKFAKDLMVKYGVPTANYAVFQTAEKAKAYIHEMGAPIVVKADGLAAGKGVVVAQTVDEACRAVDHMLVDKAFAEAGAAIVVEEYMQGREFSLMAFVHHDRVFPMIAAQDHKRAFDHDQGPNTGGMGAFAPITEITDDVLATAYEEVLEKTANAMVMESKPFTGILYAGLMLTDKGIKVIEFNARFGDPETQVVLPLLKNDLLQVLEDVLAGKDPGLQWKNQSCAGVVLAAAGYPATYQRNVPIPSCSATDHCFVNFAGVKQDGERLVSSGGRVLLVGSLAETLDQAAMNVYENITALNTSEGFIFRSDIGR
ncbi:phosphoribosylamine--glycine ligase [Virgibacillus halophilus]|uniref:Phosphoribosylamine--glycine ligase n=1 Tax=Tigheibacillus halophilus TaxID=361280 RepID=A0ABU5C9B1_9BACI|nr:phosphoribosylamine--glycine ligase [Virgibacillus halophilus]